MSKRLFRFERGCHPLTLAVLLCAAGPERAYAQQTFKPLADVVISPDFSRDRNVAVRDEANPDYDALGVLFAGMQAFPSLGVGGGGTSNVYNNGVSKLGDAYLTFRPSVYVRSDWSRHSVTFQATDDSRRYASNAPRNQDQWYTNFSGKLDVLTDLSVQLDAQAGHFFEAPFASEATSFQQVLSNYDQRMAGIKSVWTSGRVRLTGGYDHTSLRFNTLHYADGTTVSQAYRDRAYDRGFVQAEYALSPSLSGFFQMQLEQASYVEPFAFGTPNRDSTVQRYAAGISFDLAGSVRGAIGLGYTGRRYRSGFYPYVSGLSGQAEVDVFISPLTTFKLIGQRIVQEATLGNIYAYIDTRANVSVDHALRRNIIITPFFEIADQQNIGSDSGRSYVRAGGYVTYQMNRNLGLRCDLGYSRVTSRPFSQINGFSEFAGTMAITFRL